MNEFLGKRAVVTGGTRGIGEAIARQLAAAGAEVFVTARSGVSAPPDGVKLVEGDMRSRAGAEVVAAAVGEVDVVVHNVGGARPFVDSAAIPDAEWQEALDLNYLAAVRLDALLTPGMRVRRTGAVVHVSSAAVFTPIGPFLHYIAAKAALESYSHGLAVELAPYGVRVNTVTPGRVATPGGEATRELWAQLDGASVADVSTPPLGRDGEPDDIANAVLFLLSDRAGWVTGSNLVVDGGEYPRR